MYRQAELTIWPNQMISVIVIWISHHPDISENINQSKVGSNVFFKLVGTSTRLCKFKKMLIFEEMWLHLLLDWITSLAQRKPVSINKGIFFVVHHILKIFSLLRSIGI